MRKSYVRAWLICLVYLWSAGTFAQTPDITPNAASNEVSDAALQQAALTAMGSDEGTAIVLDPQNGRVRAVVNPAIAFDRALPPGSTIKPFVLLAALQSGKLTPKTHIRCATPYREGRNYIANCVHPRDLPPLDGQTALAHSCNYFFAKLGTHLTLNDFRQALSVFALAGSRQQAAGSRQQTVGSRQQAVGSKRQTAGSRQQAAGSRQTGEARTAKQLRKDRETPETHGTLPTGAWQAHYATGDSHKLRVTPVQLIAAYAALGNGGKLFRVQLLSDSLSNSVDTPARSLNSKTLEISDAHRRYILAGMRGAIAYGTARLSGLKDLPLDIYGKTGTMLSENGRGSQGWFVGLAAVPESSREADLVATPNAISLAVLVYLPNGKGSEAAARAQGIFAAFAASNASAHHGLVMPQDKLLLDKLPFYKLPFHKLPFHKLPFHKLPLTLASGEDKLNKARPLAKASGNLWKGNLFSDPTHDLDAHRQAHAKAKAQQTGKLRQEQTQTRNLREGRRVRQAPASVTVRLLTPSGKPITRKLGWEEYVAGVVTAEVGPEREAEALKAQAVIVRTYALNNLGRHQREGSDFCNLTHCQRLTAQKVNVPVAVRRAVKATQGQVLLAPNGSLAEVYYSASCGGKSADISTLWPSATPHSYLRGVDDDACTDGLHATWQDVLTLDELTPALRRDARTDTGGSVTDITVSSYDDTGRASVIKIDGPRPRSVNGWDFKIIVGRALGWQHLKSSRFTVEREGARLIFRGRGFGHGLGLCQAGAHFRAVQGASYRRILAHYFPSTMLGRE